MIPHIILGRKVFQRLIETVFGEVNGKTKTPTQGGQQKEAGPLEGSTQNQLTGRLYGKMVRRFGGYGCETG